MKISEREYHNSAATPRLYMDHKGTCFIDGKFLQVSTRRMQNCEMRFFILD
jgi:hypothetical protein